jgi:hypothetical protein
VRIVSKLIQPDSVAAIRERQDLPSGRSAVHGSWRSVRGDDRMKTTRLRRTFEENVDEVMLPCCRRPPQVMRSELRALTDEARN